MGTASPLALVLFWSLPLWAQQQPAPAPPPVLENSGKPMLLPFRCTDEDIHTAGLTCSDDDPCPVYLELSAVETAGNRIFLSGNLHSSAVTLYSTLLGSDDAGRTWREVHGRIRAAALDRIEFADAENGWISGEVMAPLPQDPFLLLTADGGKTWRQRAIFGDNAEDRHGTIRQFYFGSRTNGSLIIDRGPGGDSDRYELYESVTGGESWSIKESSRKPLSLKRPEVAADWRVRADGPSHAFQIERRQRERWIPVAAFSVKVGSCQPAGQGMDLPRE